MTISLKKQPIKYIEPILAYADVPKIEYSVLLEELKDLIEKDVIKKSDKYLRLHLGFPVYIKEQDLEFLKEHGTHQLYVIEIFKIEPHVRERIIINSSKENCERAYKALICWNRDYIKPLEELQADNDLNFIREKKRKGEITSTRCMNGECIGGILTRETAY